MSKRLYSVYSKYSSGNIKQVTCNICYDEVYYKAIDPPKHSGIHDHLITQHPESCYKCPKCDEKFITKSDLTEHKRQHRAKP